MPSQSLLVVRAVALVLPLACAESPGDEATGAGGSASGAGGAATSGGSSGSGGAMSSAGSAGRAGMPGMSGAAGTMGSAGAAGALGDDRLFVPEGLSMTDLDGEGGLTLIAFTLVQGASGPEFYAAIRNDGQTPVCDGGMMAEFIDGTEALVASASSVLQSGALFQFDDGSGFIIPCIPPGQIAMTASTELSESLVVADVVSLRYRFPAFIVDGIVPIEGFTVSELTTVNGASGNAYTGTFTNGLDRAVSNPEVAVFPINRVGRPLGMATSSSTTDISPGGRWTFETTTVNDLGVDAVAFPAASLGQ
jgi:hypothetical protein